MKVAFHFREEQLKPDGKAAFVSVLKALRTANQHSRTKVFSGTLLFMDAASDTSHDGNTSTKRVSREVFDHIVEEWAKPHPLNWHALNPEAMRAASEEEVFSICLETIDASTAMAIDEAMLASCPAVYLGAVEVDESLDSHLGAYHLCSVGRIDAESASVFWDGICEDSKMACRIDWFKDAGYLPVQFESLAAKYTIFDRDHGLSQSKRNAQSRQWMRQLFDGVIDHAISHLSDGAPDIGEKIWHALKEQREIEVEGQAAAVALACRRIFESVANSLFPPTGDTPDGRKLGSEQYKNRLLKYLEEQQVGQTEKDLIVATMEVTALEVDNLLDFANKGVHAEFDRMQARRCLLRTILLLDDLVSVRKDPLKIQIRADTD